MNNKKDIFTLRPLIQKAISYYLQIVMSGLLLVACSSGGSDDPEPVSTSFNLNSLTVNDHFSGYDYKGINTSPIIKIRFSSPFRQSSVEGSVSLENNYSSPVSVRISYENSDSTLVIKPASALNYLAKYSLKVNTSLSSKAGVSLNSPITLNLMTAIDSTDKFPVIPDDELLTLIQKQTFKYFWDFGHSVSGMARERNTSGDIVTSGGTGFGIMAIPVAVERKFITRSDALARMQKIVGFLKNKSSRFHGAFSHWINGSTGAVVPFGEKDNGADIVETSYLMMGLLTARQYFNGTGAEEFALRTDINSLWNEVEWDWFRRDGGNVLYWNWSADYGWAINVPVQGWNECLITYVLAASSTTHGIPKSVYDNGFARNGAMKNDGTYYNIKLPLGQSYGGPLFFEHYTFLGINPFGLSDAYANYQEQTINHSKINYEYCKINSSQTFGYSKDCWGLTASDIPNGYTASSPTNDVGVIAPTAAISSLPYTPEESMQALRFFYYKLGNHTWGQYGFVDAFSLQNIWFADSYLAIDQGPQIGMIENYRTGLLWTLFMSCPEVQAGLTKLGFTYKL